MKNQVQNQVNTKQNPDAELSAIWKLFTFFIDVIIQT